MHRYVFYTFIGLKINSKYFWKIVPNNGGAVATSCPEWNFTTGTTLVITNSNLDTISIYPNPVGDIVTIISPNTIITHVEIVDIRGRIVQKVDFVSGSAYGIDLSKLKSALFII